MFHIMAAKVFKYPGLEKEIVYLLRDIQQFQSSLDYLLKS